MKQYLFLATAIATASLFTGCSNNEYVGDQPDALNGTDGAIAFSMGKANTTRAGEGTGQLQKNGFYVYGTKGDPSTVVFTNYKVTYAYANAGKTSDNLRGWGYVGNSLAKDNPTPNIGVNKEQTIKYWDYGASKYQFYAFSAVENDISNSNIVVTKETTDDNAYTVDIKKGANIEQLYFADYLELVKPITTTPVVTTDENKYGGIVKLTFRNLASKVRVGFYETVPGYSIKIKNMYPANADGTEFGETAATKAFKAMCLNTEASQDSKITVKYKASDDLTAPNRAYVDAKNKQNGVGTLDEEKTLTLGNGVFGIPLETTSSSPTWDNGGAYTFFWPQTENSKPLKIKVDYTLTSNDGSTETIEVKGATATVPAEYVQWKANTAYTYIFKISDNTNGTTGTPGDPAGLYPITFDAAVVDMAENTYLTTVSTPSVTVSQNGTNFVDPNGLKFASDKEITLKVMVNGSEKDDAVIKGEFVGTYNYTKTPAQNVTTAEAEWTTISGYKLTARTGQNPEEGYWVLKVSVNEGEPENQTTSTTYVIIRVGDAEKGPETNP